MTPTPAGRPARRRSGTPYARPPARIGRLRQRAPATHTTMLATEIAGFASRYYDAAAQLRARQEMYRLLISAFSLTGLPWWDCYHQDRGDGALIIVPPGISPAQFLDPLRHHVDVLMRRGSTQPHGGAEPHGVGGAGPHGVGGAGLRLRLAAHHGHVHHTEHGVTGDALTHLFRILEAPAFKQAVDSAGAHLGVIISGRLYTRIGRRGGLINPAAYTQVHLTGGEPRTKAWLWLSAL